MNLKLLFLLTILSSHPSPGAAQEQLKIKSTTEPGDTEQEMSLETFLAGQYLPDFSFAGYKNGLHAIPNTSGIPFDVSDFGAIPNDDIDDTKAVRSALAAAHAARGPVTIRFDQGRYRISDILKIERSDITLQGIGSGGGGTTLYFPRPLNQVDKSSALNELREYIRILDKRQVEPERNVDEFFSEYSWSGGFIWIQKPGARPSAYLADRDPEPAKLTDIATGFRGQSRIEVEDSKSIKRGDIVQIQWFNRVGPEAGILRSLYGSDSKLAGSHHWSFPKRPLVRQTVRVLDVSKNTVIVADELLHDINANTPAQLSAWDGLENVGIEDLHLEFPVAPHFGHHLEQGYNGIYFTSSFDSWVRNIRITNADSGILSYSSANLTYSNIMTDGTRPAHYAVHLGNVHNALVENIRIKNPVRHSLTFNTQATKCVYKNAEVFVAPTLDQHAGANHQNLYDQVTLHTPATPTTHGPVAPIFDGSGAPYWQPGHGSFNTSWNLKVLITSGVRAYETVTIQGLDEGPNARIVGLHGNRSFTLDYRPTPYVLSINERIAAIPSLYEYQLNRRKINAPKPN